MFTRVCVCVHTSVKSMWEEQREKMDTDRGKNKLEASHQAAHTADLGSANG